MTGSVQRMIEKEASQPGRLLWMIDSLWLCGGNGEDLADLDLVGVLEQVLVGLVNDLPLGAGAIRHSMIGRHSTHMSKQLGSAYHIKFFPT